MASRRIVERNPNQQNIWVTEILDGRESGHCRNLQLTEGNCPDLVLLQPDNIIEQVGNAWVRAQDEAVGPTAVCEHPFLPPYNFVPFRSDPSRERWTALLDRAGHERLTGLCGQITCELKTLTPMFIPDAEGQGLHPVQNGEHRQKQFFRVGEDPAIPAIPPASLKGPIRSVFEALTNSCLGVFEETVTRRKIGWRRTKDHPARTPARLYKIGGHAKYQAYRREARVSWEAVNGLGLCDGDTVCVDEVVCLRGFGVGGVVTQTWEATKLNGGPLNGGWEAETRLFAGVTVVKAQDVTWGTVMGGGPPMKLRIPKVLEDVVHDGQTVDVEAIRLLTKPALYGETAGVNRHGAQRHWKWYVTRICDPNGCAVLGSVPREAPAENGVLHVVDLQSEAAKSANKCNERVFWDLDTTGQDVSDEAFRAAVQAHDSCPVELKTNPRWRRVIERDDVPAADGPLVYVATGRLSREVAGARQDWGTPPGDLYIGPVAMYREPYDNTIADATPLGHQPGACNLGSGPRDGLCPACALFGGLFPDPQGADPKKADNPLAGRVSINTAWFMGEATDADFAREVPLRILGKPRPSYFPFYLQSPDKGAAGDFNAGETRDYNALEWRRGNTPLRPPHPHHPPDWDPDAPKPVRIRGRKFYWHQPMLSEWPDTSQYRPQDQQGIPLEGEQARSNQNMTVELLGPGARFEFTVDFENLSETELKLLVWSLNLEPGMAHHFGMGKPIGLGSAEVRVTNVTVRDLQTSYASLFDQDESSWQVFDGESPEALVQGTPYVDQLALQDLRNILRIAPFGDDHLRIGYIPEGLAADRGFEYYMYHRHKPLMTIGQAVAGHRMCPDNMHLQAAADE